MHTGRRVKELRKKNGMTQPDLAVRLGISLSMMKKIETGERDPGTDTLINLSDLFNCSTDYLLGKDTPLFSEELFEELVADMEKELNVTVNDNLRQSLRSYLEATFKNK